MYLVDTALLLRYGSRYFVQLESFLIVCIDNDIILQELDVDSQKICRKLKNAPSSEGLGA